MTPRIPAALRAAPTWLVWRLAPNPVAGKKPLKIPHYVSGAQRVGDQGSPADLMSLASFDAACAAVGQRYSGVGLAMVAANGLVGLDFDNVVVDGVVLPAVAALVADTYSEISPSGTGVRAFYRGALPDRKDTKPPAGGGAGWFAVEFFCSSGYLTVTGNATAGCLLWGLQDVVAPLSPAVVAFYQSRFGARAGGAGGAGGIVDSAAADEFFGPGLGAGGADGNPVASTAVDDWFASVNSRVGMTLEQARAYVSALDPNCSREEWLNAGMALHHEFSGSQAAFDIYLAWSESANAGGSGKFEGRKDVEARWASFGRHSGSPLTGAWLLKHAKVAKVAARYEALGEWQTTLGAAGNEREIREKIAAGVRDDTRLGELEREAIAQTMMERLKGFGLKLLIGQIRKLIAPAELLIPTVKMKRPLTEFGNADRMLDRFGKSLMYVPELACWFAWTGVVWRKCTDVEISHYAKETVRGLVEEAAQHEQQSAEFFEWCAISQQARMVGNMVSLASSDPRVMVPERELDKHSHLLGVQNGVVDLRTGELRPPDPALRITKVCAVDYRVGARAPLFRQSALESFFGNAEMASFLQRVIGYAAIGDPLEDVMVIAWGDGSNGKSSLLGTVRKAMGTYAKSADASTFVADGGKPGTGGGGGGPREDLVRLAGSRFVYATEPDEGGELREGSVKAMTGGDEIVARAMFSKYMLEIKPTWVVFMPTNHKPIIKGSDNGIWRRLLLIPFTRNFKKDPHIVEDVHRRNKLALELEGVLAYIVEGARAYLQDGLSPPADVRAASEAYRSQMDVLAEWLEERCEFNSTFSEQPQRLWSSWESWAKDRGALQHVRSSIALGRRLEQRFPIRKATDGVRLRQGIRLKTSFANATFADDFFKDS